MTSVDPALPQFQVSNCFLNKNLFPVLKNLFFQACWFLHSGSCASIYIYVYLSINYKHPDPHTHIYIYTHIYKYTQTYIHIYKYTQTYIHTYIYIHTLHQTIPLAKTMELPIQPTMRNMIPHGHKSFNGVSSNLKPKTRMSKYEFLWFWILAPCHVKI